MSVFIHLFHGRDTTTEELSDWGYEGPVLGPFDTIQITYANHIKLYRDGDVQDLQFENDLVVHEGRYYGDFNITSDATRDLNPPA